MRVLDVLDRPLRLGVSNTALLALFVAVALTVVFGPGLIAPLPFIAYVAFFGGALLLAMDRSGFLSGHSVAASAVRVICSFGVAVCCLIVGVFFGYVVVDVYLHGTPWV